MEWNMTQDAGTGEDCSPSPRIAAREGGKGEDRGRAISESEQTVKKTIKYLLTHVLILTI